MALSCSDFHTSYNSAVFSSISSNSYAVFEVNKPFLKVDGLPDDSSTNLKALHQAHLSQELERLTPEACIDAYALIYQSARGSVFVVVDNPVTAVNLNQTGTLVSTVFSVAAADVKDCPDKSYNWICSSDDLDDVRPCPTPCGEKIRN